MCNPFGEDMILGRLPVRGQEHGGRTPARPRQAACTRPARPLTFASTKASTRVGDDSDSGSSDDEGARPVMMATSCVTAVAGMSLATCSGRSYAGP
jgi:hypothetical protein